MLVLAVGALLFLVYGYNRFEVINRSGVDVRDLQLVLRQLDGTEVLRIECPVLAPGECLTRRLQLLDSRAEWSYSWHGKPQRGDDGDQQRPRLTQRAQKLRGESHLE